MKTRFSIICFVVLFSCVGVASAAQLMGKPTGHYLPGPNAVEGAMNPPPGSDNLAITLVNYSFYTSRDDKGKKVPSPDIKAWVSTLRWIHMFEEGLFGGSTGFNVALTGAHMDASGALPERQNFTRIGDPSVELMQGWMFDQFAIRARLGTYIPIGAYDKNKAVNYGKDFWSFHAQLGGTVWFDQARKLAFTAIGTYETNTYMNHYNVRPGDTFTLEGGLSYNINEYISLAASYWAAWQVTDDQGNERGYELPFMPASGKHSVYGVGPYMRIMMPFIKPGTHLTLTWWHEFNARNRPEGNYFFSELVIPF